MPGYKVVPVSRELVSAFGLNVVLELECIAALKEDMGEVLHNVTTKLTMSRDIDANMVEIIVGGDPSVG